MNPAIEVTNIIAPLLLALVVIGGFDDSRPKDPHSDPKGPQRNNLR